jgi:23S rRNA (cytosine1962-C5)-methyltransferase
VGGRAIATSTSTPVVYAPNELGKQLQRGHPWLYRDRLLRAPRLQSGTWVQVRCGKFSAYGLWDARSPIAVRLFSRHGVPDAAWVSRQIRQAWEIRAPVRDTHTTAYRWLNGEGDGLPGLVVDLYNDYAIVETYADSLDALLEWVVDGLRACAGLKGVLLRRESVRVLWGHKPSRELVVEENGLRLRVDLFAGQKTGLFLDHRENRQFVEGWCAGLEVLNCFAYTGAFSLYAVRGGAARVVSVDIARQTVEETRHNLTLNGFDADAHPSIVADCFELLAAYAARRQRFDLVILDPPSLARAKESRHTAIRAYTRLNQSAMGCLQQDGLLATASCTSQVSPSAFREVLGDAAARAGKRLLILHEAGQALDHPVPAHFSEGRYLKFVLGRMQEIP